MLVHAAASALPATWAAEIDPQLRANLAERLARAQANVDTFEAQVWLAASEQRLRRFVADADARLELLRLVHFEAAQQGLDPDLVLAVIEVESAFDRFAVSVAGAQGLMQVMPFWRIEIGRESDNLTDPATNIRYGTVILAYYLARAQGDLVDALARYNGSTGQSHYPEKIVAAWLQSWRNRPLAEIPLLLDGCRRYPLRACRALP